MSEQTILSATAMILAASLPPALIAIDGHEESVLAEVAATRPLVATPSREMAM
jgi:hypothetical protein